MIFKMLATILWLGNISFKVTDSENHIEVVGDEGKIHSMSCHISFDGLYAPSAVYCDLVLLNS
jgi:myosin heavy subunit